MALTVIWDAIPNAASYDIYRSTSKFSVTALPSDKVTVPGGTNSYEYTDAVRQTVYWFIIRTVDADGNEVFGEVFNVGYFPESGPGPTTLLRGDWTFGLFGTVDADEIGQYAEISAELLKNGVTAPIDGSAVTVGQYLKCIVNGKIVFIPDTLVPVKGLITLDSNFQSYGFAGPGFDGEHAPEITLKGFDYRHRLPYGSLTKPTNVPVQLDPLSPDTLMSELGLIAALFANNAETGFSKNAANLNSEEVYMRLFDNGNSLSGIVSLHRHQNDAGGITIAGSSWTVSGFGNITKITWGSNANVNYLPVLELLF